MATKKRKKSLAPRPKVRAAAVAGAVVTIGVWVAGIFNLDVPPEVAAAFALLASTGAGYFTPEA